MILMREIDELNAEYVIGGRNIIREVGKEFLVPFGRILMGVVISVLLFAHVILHGDLPEWKELNDPENSQLYQFWLMAIGADYRMYALLTNLSMIIPTVAKGMKEGILGGMITQENVQKILKKTPAGRLTNWYLGWILVCLICSVALCHWGLVPIRVIAALCVLFSDMFTEGVGEFLFKDLISRPISVMLEVRWQERIARLRRLSAPP